MYMQSPIIRTGRIRTGAEFLEKFRSQALGSSNLRTTSKNLRTATTATAQIFKAMNQVLLLEFLTFAFFNVFHLYIHKFEYFFKKDQKFSLGFWSKLQYS